MASPSLNTKQIIEIQAIIKSWKTKLTWELLIAYIESDIGITRTRQTLLTYHSIKDEYNQKKDELRGKPLLPILATKYLSKKDKVLIATLAERDTEIAKLKAKIDTYEIKVGQLQTFIKILVDKAKGNPSLMDIFQRTKSETLKKS